MQCAVGISHGIVAVLVSVALLPFICCIIYRHPESWPQHLTMQAYPKQATVRQYSILMVTYMSVLLPCTEYDHVIDEVKPAAKYGSGGDLQLC